MKTKFISLLALFCLQLPVSASAEIILKQASLQDQEAISKLYDSISAEDRGYLVIFPKEVAPQFIKRDLENHKLFIAQDDETHKILSILKLFVIKKGDLKDILEKELRCLGPSRKQLLTESFDSSFLSERSQFLGSTSLVNTGSSEASFALNTARQVFIYYGGAYTVPEGRENHLQTQLTQKALQIIQPEVKTLLNSHPNKRQIIFAYGQVEANRSSKGMIYSFSTFVKNLVSSKFALSRRVHHQAYLAYKPDFTFNNQKLEVSFPEENIGAGNIVIFRVKRK